MNVRRTGCTQRTQEARNGYLYSTRRCDRYQTMDGEVMPSFTKDQRNVIVARDGYQCVPCNVLFGYCNSPVSHLVVHHRANRGMGGSKEANTIANGITCCSAQNTAFEASAEAASLARAHGWKLARNGLAKPSDVPCAVIVDGRVRRVLLTDEGGYKDIGS